MHRPEAAEGGEGHAKLVWSVEWKRRESSEHGQLLEGDLCTGKKRNGTVTGWRRFCFKMSETVAHSCTEGIAPLKWGLAVRSSLRSKDAFYIFTSCENSKGASSTDQID